MKIKMLDTVVVQFADKPRVIGRGETIEVDAQIADPLIAGKLAEPVDVIEKAVAKPKMSKACARTQSQDSAD